jgi:hypothetical protein
VHLPFFDKGSKGRAVVFAVVSFITNLTVYCYSKGLCLGFILVVLGALVLVALGVVAIRLISVSLTIVLLVSVILLGLILIRWLRASSILAGEGLELVCSVISPFVYFHANVRITHKLGFTISLLHFLRFNF